MDVQAQRRHDIAADERIKREIEEYRTLSQLVMQLTKGISENVEKVRASADRPTWVTQETE
jgi:hypothetical protein